MLDFMGLQIIKHDWMVIDTGERSWKRVRSPGRARRRLKRGFRQNIDIVWAPDPNVVTTPTQIIGHPATIARLATMVKEKRYG